jgi:hypothetical protein
MISETEIEKKEYAKLCLPLLPVAQATLAPQTLVISGAQAGWCLITIYFSAILISHS